jgi:hypothetical protein
LIGRTEVFGRPDLARVRELQAGMTLRPLGASSSSTQPLPMAGARAEPRVDPQALVQAMPPHSFFTELCRLLAVVPPKGDDPILAALARVGIGPGDYDPSALPTHVRRGLEQGWSLGRRAISLTRSAVSARPGWGPGPKVPMGVYGTNYLVRAIVAHVGLGANPRKETVYMNAARDFHGRPLDAARRNYVLRFEAGGLPPVRAFWSVSLYDKDGFFVPSALGRHVLGSHDGLARTPEGALEILVQHTPPEDTRTWLPAPAGRFELSLRMYWPE